MLCTAPKNLTPSPRAALAMLFALSAVAQPVGGFLSTPCIFHRRQEEICGELYIRLGQGSYPWDVLPGASLGGVSGVLGLRMGVDGETEIQKLNRLIGERQASARKMQGEIMAERERKKQVRGIIPSTWHRMQAIVLILAK